MPVSPPTLPLPPAIALAAACWAAFATAVAAEPLRVGGTGAATEMLRYLGTPFTQATSEADFKVVPSLGSTGAILAVADGVLGAAVTGRPLKRDEAARGLTQIVLSRTPFGLATSHPSPSSLGSASVARFFAAETSVWSDGVALRPILRPRSDSDTVFLGGLLPGMAQAIEQVRTRPYVPVAATDQDNADLAERTPGSLIGTTFTQIRMEMRNLRFVAIDGVEPTLEAFERGVYPYGKEFYLVYRDPPSAAVARLIGFLRSPAGHAALRQTGNLPLVGP